MMYFHQENSTGRILPGGRILPVEFKILPGNQPLQTGNIDDVFSPEKFYQ